MMPSKNNNEKAYLTSDNDEDISKNSKNTFYFD